MTTTEQLPVSQRARDCAAQILGHRLWAGLPQSIVGEATRISKHIARFEREIVGRDDGPIRLEAASPPGVICPACDGEGCNICGTTGRISALRTPAPAAELVERARRLIIDLDALLGKPIDRGPVAEKAFQMVLAALSGEGRES